MRGTMMESQRRCVTRRTLEYFDACWELRDFARPRPCLDSCVNLALNRCTFWERLRRWIRR